MKSIQVMGFLLASLLLIPTVEAFSDTTAEAIEYLEKEGIVEGYADGSFKPDKNINRAEFVKIVIEAKHPGEAKGSNCFSDVTTEWYAPYVCFAKELGIVQGYADGRFKPADPITLAEALKVALETYQIEVCTNCSTVWYEPYYNEASNLNLLAGISSELSHEVSRGEMAQLVYNIIVYEMDKSIVADSNTSPCEEKLFGFWGLNGTLNGDTEDSSANLLSMSETTGLNAFVVSAIPSYAVDTLLPAVQNANAKDQNAKIISALRMSSGNSNLIGSDGNFSLSRWKTFVDAWKDPNVESFLKPFLGEELQWHMILDDIDTFESEFGAKNPSAADLAAMAEYSKSLFPEIKTFIREDADRMPSGEYPFLDATLNQYTSAKGPLSSYISNNLSAAQKMGIDSIWGLNIVDGGDGSSGHFGSSRSKYVMSPEEIQNYGEDLLNTSGSLGLLMWKFDAKNLLADGVSSADRFSTEAYLSVFKKLASLAHCE